VLLGYGLMGLSLLINIYALSRGVKVKEIPMVETLSYVFVPLLAYAAFGERIGIKKLFSILIIVMGVILFFC